MNLDDAELRFRRAAMEEPIDSRQPLYGLALQVIAELRHLRDENVDLKAALTKARLDMMTAQAQLADQCKTTRIDQPKK